MSMSSLKSRFLRTTSSRTGRCFCIPESLPPISANAPRALIPLTSSFLPPIALVVELPGYFRFVPLLFSHACLFAAGFDGYDLTVTYKMIRGGASRKGCAPSFLMVSAYMQVVCCRLSLKGRSKSPRRYPS